MPFLRPHRGSRWLAPIGALLVLTLLSLAAAGLWHRHADAEHPSGDTPDHCAVCTAIDQDRTDGTPVTFLAPAPDLPLGAVAERPRGRPGRLATRRCAARGPPARA